MCAKCLAGFLWISVFGQCLFAADVVVETLRNGQDEQVFEFRVADEKLRDIPQWDGHSPDIPLSMERAIFSARKKAEKDHPNEIGELKRVNFSKRLPPDGISLWAYSIQFRSINEDQLFGYWYVVLLDGSVIQPVRRIK